MMIRGDRLRELRKKQSVSHEDICHALGMGKAQLLRYETGRSDATTETLCKLARYFRVSSDYLLGMDELPPEPERHELATDEDDILRAWRSFSLTVERRAKQKLKMLNGE
jgi:transcriptional regulator with XRE-family HTH domain